MSSFKFRIKMLRQYKDLIKELVTRDIKLKYRRSFLGYVWSVLNPLLVMLVMTFVFSAMFKRNIENYPVYLLIGRMTYDFLTTSTNQAMRSVTGNAALMKKTYIPKYIFTVAKVTSCLVDFVFSLGALLIVMIFTGARFHLTMLALPLVFAQLYLFCMGLGFLLSALHVFFRDIQYIYKAITTAWMYLTPIFYPLEQLPSSMQILIKTFNPMYYYVAQFRDMVLAGHFPGSRIFIGGWIFAVLMMLIGLWVFQKRKDRFILFI
ncbi:MAG: ABC transporter permease [Lachnospiraceae bacterium]|nr:ABC transporter permease [Lachnospiraceae bacterium]